jgi:hypothetical protein
MRRLLAQQHARSLLARDDVDESHEREVAVDDGAGSADHFDAVDLFDRNQQRRGGEASILPGNRNAVEEDLRIARVEREVEAAHDH